MKGEEILLSKDFMKCVEFHGHICPGLAIGFKAARILMERLNVCKARDEELLTIVESDACGDDAIQVMTGCTFGKGNFIFRNYGKHAFSLVDRKGGRSLRVSYRPTVFKADPEYLALSGKVQNDEASPVQLERFRQLQVERARKILDAEPEVLFKIEDISPDIPSKAMIVESGTCNFCGELTKMDLLREINGKKICIPCEQRQRVQH
jgi:formylmethanofuran dehydrogenase subunit E